MEYKDIIEDLKNPEAEIVECKISFNSDDVGRTVAAFSTKRGGRIYLGVNKDRIPVGMICGERLNDEIEQVARTVVPPASICIDRCPHDKEREIVRITVHKGSGSVYSYRNISYERREGINHPLLPEEIIEIGKRSKKLHFDEMKALSVHRPALITDIDEFKVKAFLEFMKGGPIDKLDLKQFFTNYELFVNGQMQVKNVAIMFFGKNPSEFVPQNKVSICVFPSDEITENSVKTEISGDTIDIINRTYVEVLRNVRTFSFVNGLRRIDAPEYPPEVLREAIINAVAHRDYFIDNSEIFIKMFKSRIEISNPGGFPYDNFTFEEIEKVDCLSEEILY